MVLSAEAEYFFPNPHSNFVALFFVALSSYAESITKVNDKISLNLELGKSELRQLNYLAAQNHFAIARNILTSSSRQDPIILAEISALSDQLKTAMRLQVNK